MQRIGLLIGLALLVSAGGARAQASEPAPSEPPAPEPSGPETTPPARARPAPEPLGHSDWSGGIDASVGPLPDLSEDVAGAAVTGRFGYRLDNGRLFLTPEGVLGLVVVARQLGGAALISRESAWIGAGVRAGVRLWRFEPGLYSHGFVWFGGKTTAPAVQVGASLDFRITRSVAAGGHTAYVVADAGRSIDFGIVGLHVDVMR